MDLTDFRIFCVLLPIYYQFLRVLCVYCLYKCFYFALLGGAVGNDFGEYSNPFNDSQYFSTTELSQTQIANLCGFALYQFLEATISHVVTFWFLQPSSGFKSLKLAMFPASLIGVVDAVCTVLAIIDVSNRAVLLAFHAVMLSGYALTFVWMIRHQKLRWRLFYFYILFFVVLYVLYALADVFVLMTHGELDGCLEELSEILFQFGMPFVLALLLFDDSSYWLQLSAELIGDRKDFVLESQSHSQSQSQMDAESDLFIAPNANALLAAASMEKSTPISMAQHSKSMSSLMSDRTPVTKSLYIPKLQQSVGRFDAQASFSRVMDQLSMTIPTLSMSDIEMVGDINATIGFGAFSAVLRKSGECVAIKSLYSFSDANYQYVVVFLVIILYTLF